MEEKKAASIPQPRRRIALGLTAHQVEELERVFEETQYPNALTRYVAGFRPVLPSVLHEVILSLLYAPEPLVHFLALRTGCLCFPWCWVWEGCFVRSTPIFSYSVETESRNCVVLHNSSLSPSFFPLSFLFDLLSLSVSL